MKTSAFIAFAALILQVAAYGSVGTFERLWFWYAYQLDTENKSIAPNCAKQSGGGQKCSFAQFMSYIEQPDASNPTDPSKLSGVDTNNIDAATKALEDGKFTGTYDCTRVYQGLSGVPNVTPAKDNVAGLFQKVGYLCQGKVGGAAADVQQRLQDVTNGVARGRQENAINAYQSQLKSHNPPIDLRLGPVPLFNGATVNYQGIDPVATRNANPNVDRKVIAQAIRDLQTADGDGHTKNAKTAKEAAANVALVCS